MGSIQNFFSLKSLFVLVSVIFLLGYGYVAHQKQYPSTDNAYTNAHLVNMAAEVSGPIVKIYVRNHQRVQKDQLLFDIDPAPFQVRLDRAAAHLEIVQRAVQSQALAIKAAEALVRERKAELTNALKDEKRILSLVELGQVAFSEGDRAVRSRTVADSAWMAAKDHLESLKTKFGPLNESNAQIREAKAVLAEAELALKYTHIRAPVSGELANFELHQGAMVTAQQALFVLVDDGQWWVDANYKETDLALIHPGQPVQVTMDIEPDRHFQGHVESISPGSGSVFSLLPPENASGNWIKVTQRFPVKILIDVDQKALMTHPLRVGASCRVRIDARG